MTQHIGADKLNHIVRCEVCLKRIAAMDNTEGGARVCRKIKPKHKQWDNPNYFKGGTMTTPTHDGFQKGSGTFPCEECGKLTRTVHGTFTGMCQVCNETAEKENAIADGQCIECSGELKRYETNYSDWICVECKTMFDDNGDKAVKHRGG